MLSAGNGELKTDSAMTAIEYNGYNGERIERISAPKSVQSVVNPLIVFMFDPPQDR